MKRALLASVLSTITFVGCTQPASQPGSDAAIDAPSLCDPHVGVCRATLRWNSDGEGVRLSNGEVRPLTTLWDWDVNTGDGRFYTLLGRDLCRFGESASGTEHFDRLEDIPTEESSCTRERGMALYFSHDGAPSGGSGFLLRDTGDQLYRVRVVGSHFEGEALFMELEWSAI